MADSQNMVSGKASESLDLMVSSEFFIPPKFGKLLSAIGWCTQVASHVPVSGSKRRCGRLTRHGRGDWSSMGGGCVDAAGGKVSVEVPEGPEVVGGASLGGSSLGVAPCVMGGEATSVGEGESVGVTRGAVTDGWGASCGRVGGDGGRG